MITLQVRMDADYIQLVRRFEERFPNQLDDVVRQVTSEAVERIMDNTPVKTGQLRRGWIPTKKGNCSYNITNRVSYVNPVEYGSRAHVIEGNPFLTFIGNRADGTKGFIRKKRVMHPGAPARYMMTRVIPWLTETMPIRIKAKVTEIFNSMRGA